MEETPITHIPEELYEQALKVKCNPIEFINSRVKKPKSNGYRSLHLIVQVPIFLSDKALSMKVEVQIRTIAMDFWASLEHQGKYKKGIEDAGYIS